MKTAAAATEAARVAAAADKDNPLSLLTAMRAEVAHRRRFRHPTELFHKLLGPRDRLREVVRHGLRWRLQYRGYERGIIKKARWEEYHIEYFFTQAHKRGCDVFLDIGANIGLYSMLAAKMRLFKEIHACEPSPGNFARLQWHARANGFGGAVRAYQTALSDFCGTARLSAEDAAQPGGTAIVAGQEAGVEVPCATLDSLFNFSGRRLAVKMDIERHELFALRGAEKLFANNDVFLQIEVVNDNTEVINELMRRGFSMEHYLNIDFYFTKERTKQTAD